MDAARAIGGRGARGASHLHGEREGFCSQPLQTRPDPYGPPLPTRTRVYCASHLRRGALGKDLEVPDLAGRAVDARLVSGRARDKEQRHQGEGENDRLVRHLFDRERGLREKGKGVPMGLYSAK
jgi:hypothetical protein